MLQLAAVFSFLFDLVHSVLGERYILIRLFPRENLPKLFGGTQFITRTLRLAWHLSWSRLVALTYGTARPNKPLKYDTELHPLRRTPQSNEESVLCQDIHNQEEHGNTPMSLR